MANIKSLFDRKSMEDASNIHEVTIFNAVTDEAINGLLQEQISLSFTPKYYNVKEVSETIGGIIEKIDSTQILPTNMVSTAQIFDGGDYLDLNVKLRITDTTGDGAPMKAATLLGQWGSPWDQKLRSWDTTQIYLEDKINSISNTSRLTGESPHAIRASKDKDSNRTRSDRNGANVDKWGAVNWSEKLADATRHARDGNFGEAATEFLGLLTDVKLSVAIGDWFFARGNMVLKSVTQSFSREQGPAGPLYIDLDINMQSLTVLTKRNVLELYPLVQKSGDDDIIARSYAQLKVAGTRFGAPPEAADKEPTFTVQQIQSALDTKASRESEINKDAVKLLSKRGL